MTDPKPTHVQPRPTLQPAPTFTRWADAYEAYKGVIAAVSDDTLLHINVDVASVVTMICGAWPQLEVLRPQLAMLPEFDPVMFDRVEGLALALAHTQAMYLSASTPVGTLPALAADGNRLREWLLDEVRLLAKRGLVDAGFTASFRGGSGYKVIAFELAALVNCVRMLPATVRARLHVTGEELTAADDLERAITLELGRREQAPAVAAAVSRTRSQAFTLVAGAYDEVRRGVLYVRWHGGDGEALAPSLYAGRGGRRGTESEDVAGGTVVAPAGAAAATPKPRIAPGMPGSSPFIDEP